VEHRPWLRDVELTHHFADVEDPATLVLMRVGTNLAIGLGDGKCVRRLMSWPLGAFRQPRGNRHGGVFVLERYGNKAESSSDRSRAREAAASNGPYGS
jgi:hypothetical protein